MYSYVFPFYSLQFFVPDESAVNKDFIKDVLAGKKNLLKKSEVQHINVKRYDEISVKAMYPKIDESAPHLPDAIQRSSSF